MSSSPALRLAVAAVLAGGAALAAGCAGASRGAIAAPGASAVTAAPAGAATRSAVGARDPAGARDADAPAAAGGDGDSDAMPGDGWRSDVPERCRDEQGAARPGCSARRVITMETEIEILEGVTFVGNTAELAPSSHRALQAVASTLLGNPSILVLEVRGHSDSLPHPVERAELARQRAEVVAAYLVAHGVDPARLTTYGASDSERLYPAEDPRNRRVEFVILARDE